MAIIIDMEEVNEDNGKRNQAQPSTSLRRGPKSFTAILDPSDPLALVGKVLDFLGRESDFLGREWAEKEMAVAVTMAKERKKMGEKEIAKAEQKRIREENEEMAKPDAKEKSMKEKEEVAGLMRAIFIFNDWVVSKGNLAVNKYSWIKTLQEVIINGPIHDRTEASFVVFEMKKSHLEVSPHKQPPIIEGELHQPTKPAHCSWKIGQTQMQCAIGKYEKDIFIPLSRQKQLERQKSHMKGKLEINIQNVEPLSSKIEKILNKIKQLEQILQDNNESLHYMVERLRRMSSTSSLD